MPDPCIILCESFNVSTVQLSLRFCFVCFIESVVAMCLVSLCIVFVFRLISGSKICHPPLKCSQYHLPLLILTSCWFVHISKRNKKENIETSDAIIIFISFPYASSTSSYLTFLLGLGALQGDVKENKEE